MKIEPNEPSPEEPQGHWIAAPVLTNTQVLELVLCRFTGDKLGVGEVCPSLQAGLRPEVFCAALYFQADALQVKAGTAFSIAQDEVRAPHPLGEPVGTAHK